MAYRVYVLIGDGEADEGQIWEAALGAAKYQTGNLTAVLDYNKYQQTGAVNDVMPSLEPVADKWEAFGWDVREMDGHNMAEVLTALQAVRRVTDQPQLIMAHTLKGRGLSPFEGNAVNRKHGEPLNKAELAIALAELDELDPVDAGEQLPHRRPGAAAPGVAGVVQGDAGLEPAGPCGKAEPVDEEIAEFPGSPSEIPDRVEIGFSGELQLVAMAAHRGA